MSRILKGEGAPRTDPAPVRTPIVPSEVLDARGQARELLERAAAQAEALRVAAEAEAAALRASAEAELVGARTRGREEGLADAHAAATELLARAHAERDALLAGSQREVLELSLLVAEKVLGREIREREAAADIVAQALGAVRRARRIRVRISPEDLVVLRAREKELVARLTQLESFELCEDAAIARGGCVVETESGSVDARLETQLAALRRALCGGG